MDFVQLKQYYRYFLTEELQINQWVQERLSFIEPFWFYLSAATETSNLMDYFVPLVGVFHQELLLRLVCALSVVNTLSTSFKWCYRETRPYWWLRELYASGLGRYSNLSLSQYPLSCDASPGLPSSHAMSFTVFISIVSSYILIFDYYKLKLKHKVMWRYIAYVVVALLIGCVWLSRLYLATEFLHQCILGSYVAVHALHIFERKTVYLYSRQRLITVPIVLVIGIVPFVNYYALLLYDMDPHWSVREAFKWCPDTLYLRHETSTIFMLARDLGNLMGVALSCPLFNCNSSSSSFRRRLLTISGLEIVNFLVRYETPKQYGRFAYISYEFTRNTLHSFTLLRFMDRIK